ncbi:MAG: hypothetical protein GEV06_09595 [Luteitalea sp.]|nr:hypothetical protein [Luteitalea sp.]
MRLSVDLRGRATALFLTTGLLWWSACSQEPRENRAETVRSAARAAQAASAGVSATSEAEARAAAAEPTHKALVRAFDKLQTAYPYRFTDRSTVTTNIGLSIQPMVRISEHAAPDRARVAWKRGEFSGEIIAVGNKTYMQANGRWQAGKRTSAPKPSADLTQMLSGGITDVELTGTETLAGAPSSTYTFRFRWKALGLIFDGTGKAWVRTEDGLPQRAEMETRTGLFDMKSQVAYEYDVPIEIEPPAL